MKKIYEITMRDGKIIEHDILAEIENHYIIYKDNDAHHYRKDNVDNRVYAQVSMNKDLLISYRRTELESNLNSMIKNERELIKRSEDVLEVLEIQLKALREEIKKEDDNNGGS